MNEIKEYNDLAINKYGTIGSLMNGYLDSYLNRDEIEVINKNIDILNKKLEDFNIFKYRIIHKAIACVGLPAAGKADLAAVRDIGSASWAFVHTSHLSMYGVETPISFILLSSLF